MTEHLVITSLPNIFKTLLFVCQFRSLALVAMVRQPKVLLMIIHSLLWLCSNISQRLFVCCIFECSDHLTSGGCIALHCNGAATQMLIIFLPAKSPQKLPEFRIVGQMCNGNGWVGVSS